MLGHLRSSTARLRRLKRRPFIFRSQSREASRTSLDSFLASLPPGDGFGDDHRVRAAGSSRIVFQNINGVPDDPEDHKQQLLHQWWQLERVDAVLLAEMNKYWPAVPQQSRWRERLRTISSRGFHTVVAYNEHQRRRNHNNTSQYGGCSTTALNQASHAVRSSGADSLGRFSWIRFQGRRRSSPSGSPGASSSDLVIVSAYRPNPPSAGKETVWYQQMAYFSRQDRLIDPREAFLVDLLEAVDGWIEEGCEVIVGLDANEDLLVADSKSFRGRMISSGLKEVILSRHRLNFQATYQRNNSNKPIDGIFATAGVPVFSAGYYPFDEHAPSDHRALWIDIDWERILGRFRPTKQQFVPRRLTMDNQKVVENYLRLAEAEYQRFNIPGRLAGLMSSVYTSFGLTGKQQRRFNCIHADAYTARRLAERKCRKLKMGGKPWSPKSQDLWDRISLWRILLKGRRNCRVSSRKVRRLMQKVGEPLAWTLSTAELEARLAQARAAHRSLHKTDTPQRWRRDHLSITVASAKKARFRSARNSTKNAQLARIKQREETRRRRKARGRGFSGGLRAIQVDCPSTKQCITITAKQLVEDGCMWENTARYQQTFTPFPTPPMVPPLYPMFSGTQARINSERLLCGDLPLPSSLDRPTSSFLRQCRFRQGSGTQPLSVSLENHVQFWSKMPENKGSEPHGLHNGHFKAGVQSEMLASCDAAFREILISTGFVPDQWKHLMNFAIEKQPGDFRLSKMRTIQMMNSEFQANNKLIGKTSMAYAEANSIIPPGQCGARKHHQSKDLALSKRLIWDSLILDRQAAGWVSNDAKSCFDRIVHWVGKLAMMRFGIPWEAVSMIFDTLAEAKHRVRTGFGDSPRIFEPSSSIPFQGCGQGNGAGPAIWVAISAILIDMMDAEGFGYSSRTALSDDEIFASCFSFIDDTDVIQSGDINQSGEDLVPSVSSALTLWAGGVRASGGAINPDKSYWWLIDFAWLPSGRWRFRSSQEMPGVLRLAGLNGELETLRRLAPDEAERTLGMMMAPLETGTGQLTVLLDKARDWANSLRPQHLLPYDVFPLIRSTIMKSLEYPMSLTTFSLKEWLRIMSPILLRCLPKAGVCRNFPRVVVFAPLRFQGLGLPHPLSLQVYHHLSMLLRHSINPSQTSDYLLSVLESHQLETGSSFGLLQQQFDNTGILASDTWLKRVWRQLDNLDIRVEFSHPPLDLYREGDQLLVDLFVDALVDQEVLLWLYWCRMYLQVTTVSDLLTADGRFITLAAWNGCRSNSLITDYNWPRTVRPASRHWDTWRSVLSQTLLQPHTSTRRVKLKLGSWTDSLDCWKWLFSPTRKSLFRRTGEGWLRYCPISRRTKSTYCPACRPWSGPPPPDSLRVTVDLQAGTDFVIISGIARPPVTPSSPPVHRSVLSIWEEWRSECTPTWGWVPDSVHLEGSEAELLDDLLHHRLRIVSDGSCKGEVVDEKMGTAATQLRSRSGKSTLWLRTRAPGNADEMSPYRCELTGIYSGVLALSWLCSLVKKPVKPFRVHPACDGLEALRLSFDTWPLGGTEADFDLLSSIRATLRDLPVVCYPRHVKGHVDRYKSWSQMNWWERRNFEVDRVAQDYADELLRGPTPPLTNPKFFSEPCAVFIGERKMSSLSLGPIDEAVVLPDLRAYWADKGRPAATFDLVHWPTVERAMKSLPPGIQRWTTKHTVGMCGVGKFRVHWGLDLVNQCPLCGQPEDHHHVPRCAATSAKLQWSKSILQLQSWLDRSSTAPAISTFLLALLSTIRGHQPIPPLLWYQTNRLDPSLLSKARDDQLCVGPQGLLEGLLVPHWATLQQSHFRALGSRRSGTLWAAQLSQQLLLVGHQMWLHRNEVFHSDDSAASLQLRTDLDRRIAEQFRLGLSGLPAIVHPMLQPHLQRSILHYSNDDKSDWLAILVHARRQARRSLAAQRSLLWAYFHPAES